MLIEVAVKTSPIIPKESTFGFFMKQNLTYLILLLCITI
jgi:hypothetical protein